MPTTDIPLRLLDTIQIASPCSMQWGDMVGDDRVRHCAQCDLNVFNFSNMTADEAEDLVRNKQGRLCAGFYRRADGTVLTRDCPVGLRAVRQRIARTTLRAVAVLAFVLTGGLLARAADPASGRLRAVQPFARLSDWLTPYLPGASRPMQKQIFVAGEICVPPPPSSGTPAPPPKPAAN